MNGIDYAAGESRTAIHFSPEGVKQLIDQRDALLEAMKRLFEHCMMTHKHWGEGCNRKEADAAIQAAQAAIANAELKVPRIKAAILAIKGGAQ